MSIDEKIVSVNSCQREKFKENQMATIIIKSPKQRKQRRILGVFNSLDTLPKVTISSEINNGDINVIWIKHEQEYVPNFKLVWCSSKEHFRVYIHIANNNVSKINAGYCICTIPNSLAAVGFAMLYSFIHKHRANNKSEAV